MTEGYAISGDDLPDGLTYILPMFGTSLAYGMDADCNIVWPCTRTPLPGECDEGIAALVEMISEGTSRHD
jgi:hypothetical protein